MSGPFGSSQWMYNAGGGLYDHEISNSLRFEDGDSPTLRRTCSTAGNRKTWTTSLWVKRANLGTFQRLGINSGTSNTKFSGFFFTSNDVVEFFHRNNTSDSYAVRTDRVFRDISSWYHFVLACDTTQGTAANRVKMYVNGEQVLFPNTVTGTSGFPSQNQDMEVNNTAYHQTIGADWNGADKFDGYHADITHIDGLQLTPSSFAETKNDIWIPKDTSGLTFGTNGFRLQFKQTGTGTASSSTIGADTSGNNNHYTSANLVASDVMPDSPTNNFATWNPIALDTLNIAFSEGNLQAVKASDSASPTTRSTFGMTQGSWYWETRLEAFAASGGTVYGVGIDTDETDQGDSDNSYNTVRFVVGAAVGPVYQKTTNGSFGGNVSYGTNASNGDIIGVKLDIDNEVVAFSRNGTFFADISLPALEKTYFASNITDQGSNTYTAQINFGQDSTFAGNETAQGNADENGIGDFYYAPPSGSLALCTANLPAPVAAVDPAQGGSPQDYFNTVLYTGNGSTQSITGVGFQPDWIWIKERSSTSSHALFDSVRGVNKVLASDLADEEDTSNSTLMTAFGSDGFSLGNNNRTNQNTITHVAWNWKAGTAFSNDASATGVGSIDSSGSVNTDVGFSIISYTGNGSNGATVAHGLGVSPDMIIAKTRDSAENWQIFHSALGGTKRLYFLTNAEADTAEAWNDTNPSATVITLGTSNLINKNTDEYIAYCFAEVEGYSKVGSSYTGNGNTDGPFVYTGFRPAFVMLKRTDSTGGWHIHDNKRNTGNLTETMAVLSANLNDGEYASVNYQTDFLSNGFKLRNTTAAWNANGGTFIYMAFAEQPFKYANAR
jgi:hypothetical protein